MDTADRTERRDRAQMECWERAIKKIKERNGWSGLKAAEWLLRQPHDLFELILCDSGGEWGKILKELGGAK